MAEHRLDWIPERKKQDSRRFRCNSHLSRLPGSGAKEQAMVRIGIAGIGFMGVTHYKAARDLEGGRVTALFTRDPKKLAGDWTNVRGNFGEAGGVQDLSGVRRHETLDALLNDAAVDLIDICLPTYLHKEVTLRALALGKHVLVEKPIALNIEDADEMIAAANTAGRLLMVGQVLRFFPEFAFIKDAMQTGDYGRLLGAHFKRIISRPDWSGDNWFSDPVKTGGPVIDLHIHDADFVQFLFGMPSAVFATGVAARNGQVDYLVTQYLFEGRDACVTSQSGAISQSGVPFEHGYDVYFEGATLRYNSLTGASIHLALKDGTVSGITPAKPDAFAAELQAAVDGVRAGHAPPTLAGPSARNSLLLCLREAESVRRREIVRV
jgi:predicted dehydrogenase